MERAGSSVHADTPRPPNDAPDRALTPSLPHGVALDKATARNKCRPDLSGLRAQYESGRWDSDVRRPLLKAA